jgi:16S rRNA (cytidine1402-2'-O)-methyltransferase
VSGALILVPNALDLGSDPLPLDAVLPRGVIARAAQLGHWAAEDARSARAFLKRVAAVAPLATPLQSLAIAELPRPRKGGGEVVGPELWQQLLQPALDGHDLGLLSEAGLPGVADPGAGLVAAAHRCGVGVEVLPGPCSLTLALAASGLNGQSFAFVGYLPQEAAARARRLRELEAHSRRQEQTQLLIETPYRNAALLHALVATLAPDTRLSVSVGLTLARGWTRCGPVAQWRERPCELTERVPAVFAFLAG